MHRHRIGTRLLHELMVQSIELGARAVSLEVRVTNWGAQRLYGRFGFHPVGIRRNYYQELQRGRPDHVDRRRPHARPTVERLRARSWPSCRRRCAPRDHAGHRDLLRRNRRRRGGGRFRAARQPDRVPGPPARTLRRGGARGRGARPCRSAQPADGGSAGRGRHRVRRHRRGRGHRGSRAGGSAAGGHGGGQGRGPRHRRRPGRGEPSRGALLGELPRARTARAAVRGAHRLRRTHDAGARAGRCSTTRSWARRSTTRRARPSTRSRGCSDSGSPEDRRSTRWRPTAIRTRSASRARWRIPATTTSR